MPADAEILELRLAWDKAEIERLRALLRRARQAFRSLDELSDEELGNIIAALDAEVM